MGRGPGYEKQGAILGGMGTHTHTHKRPHDRTPSGTTRSARLEAPDPLSPFSAHKHLTRPAAPRLGAGSSTACWKASCRGGGPRNSPSRARTPLAGRPQCVRVCPSRPLSHHLHPMRVAWVLHVSRRFWLGRGCSGSFPMRGKSPKKTSIFVVGGVPEMHSLSPGRGLWPACRA